MSSRESGHVCKMTQFCASVTTVPCVRAHKKRQLSGKQCVIDRHTNTAQQTLSGVPHQIENKYGPATQRLR